MIKTRWVVTGLALAALVVVGGCGSSEPTSAPTAGNSSSNQSKPSAATADAPGEDAEQIQADAQAQPAGDAAAPAEGQWGDLVGQVVFVGEPSPPKTITPDKDVEYCSQHTIYGEYLRVGQGGGLADVVVTLFLPTGASVTPHPDYAATSMDTVVIDNTQCHFEPHVVLMRTTQKLEVKNSDEVAHNTNVQMFRNQSFNSLIPAGGSLEKTLPQPERLPVAVHCSIHTWMSSWLVVQDHPYMAVTGEDGKFEIKNLPVGEHEFQLWNNVYLKELKTALGATDARGRIKVTIRPGVNDLGKIEAPKDLFPADLFTK